MRDPDVTPSHSRGRDAAFPATRWTWIQQAGEGDAEARSALAKLCEVYWYPVYAYVRRVGRSPEDAEDLTQGFFSKLLEKEAFHHAKASKGRFRNFLLSALKHHLTDEHRKASAQKRGGGSAPVSIDQERAERRFQSEPRTAMTPEDAFERQWAETLLRQVFALLQENYASRGKASLYEALEPYVSWGEASVPQQEVADRLGMKVSTLRSEIFQLRRQYGHLLHQTIASTVDSPQAVDDELRHLRKIFARTND